MPAPERCWPGFPIRALQFQRPGHQQARAKARARGPPAGARAGQPARTIRKRGPAPPCARAEHSLRVAKPWAARRCPFPGPARSPGSGRPQENAGAGSRGTASLKSAGESARTLWPHEEKTNRDRAASLVGFPRPDGLGAKPSARPGPRASVRPGAAICRPRFVCAPCAPARCPPNATIWPARGGQTSLHRISPGGHVAGQRKTFRPAPCEYVC